MGGRPLPSRPAPGVWGAKRKKTKRDARFREHDGGGVGAVLFSLRPEQGPLANASEAKRAEARARRLRAFTKS